MGRKPSHPAADQLQLFDAPVPRARRRAARTQGRAGARTRGAHRVSRSARLWISTMAIGIATAGIIGGSFASWTAQTTNPGNAVTAGTLAMTNNKPAAAVFTATNVKPGDTGFNTVTITNSGNVAMAVKLTKDNVTTTGIEPSLGLQVYDQQRNWCYWPSNTSGTCATYGAWNTSLANLPILSAAGGATWPSGELAHTFTISWQLSASSPNSDQGKTGSFRLVWDGT
jgi:predicted ribosomally synthesized peptide with SipW-like signal peptide